MEAADQATALVQNVTLEELAADRQRRDALLWNFTVLGAAAAQSLELSGGSGPPARQPGHDVLNDELAQAVVVGQVSRHDLPAMKPTCTWLTASTDMA